eukprot:2675687-Lingulodinium_polyedra.AAC.1
MDEALSLPTSVIAANISCISKDNHLARWCTVGIQSAVVGEFVELNILSACRRQMAVALFGKQPLDEARTMD